MTTEQDQHQDLEQWIRDGSLITSSNLDNRVLDAARVELTVEPKSKTTWGSLMHSPFLRRRIVPSIAVAVLIALSVLWFLQPAESWAQVVEAVKDKPWILTRGQTPDGEVQQWFSIQRRVSAVQTRDNAIFVDINDGVVDSYSKGSEHISRRSIEPGSSDQRGFLAFAEIFQGIFRGDKTLDISDLGEDLNIELSRTDSKGPNGNWHDYRITMTEPGGDKSVLTIRVDAETNLPAEMIVNNAGQEPVTFDVEFPEAGPESIYDLGVPTETTRKSYDPTPENLKGLFKEIVESMKAVEHGFGDYGELSILSDVDSEWYVGTPQYSWQKGGLTRLDMGFVDPGRTPEAVVPDDDTDQRTWWLNRCEQLWFYPLQFSDGTRIYMNGFQPAGVDLSSMSAKHPQARKQSDWAKTDWTVMGEAKNWPKLQVPLHQAYPDLSGYFTNAQIYDTAIKPITLDNGQDAIELTVTWKSGATSNGQHSVPKADNQAKYVLDPAKNYICLQHKTQMWTTVNGERSLLSETSNEQRDFRRSPTGFWYPGEIVTRHFFKQDDNEISGAAKLRFYLDFDVNMPDELFVKPKVHGTGIPH